MPAHRAGPARRRSSTCTSRTPSRYGALGRRRVHVLGAGDRRRRSPSPPATHAYVHGRHDAATRRSRAGRAGRRTTSTPTFTFTGVRRRVELPVPGRHRGLHGLHVAVHDRDADARARTRSRSARRAPPERRTRRRRRARSRSTRVAPDTTITGGPSGTVASTSATFTFTLDRGRARRSSARSTAPPSAPAPPATPASPQGAHTFQVRAVDAAGNADATPATRTWTVDTVAPDTTIADRPDRRRVEHHARRSPTPRPRPARRSSARSTAARSAPAPSSYTGLAQGAHTFQVRAIDAAGNADATPATRDVDRRHGRARHHDLDGPSGTTTATRRRRSRSPPPRPQDVPVRARRRRLRVVHLAAHDRRCSARARTPSGARRRRRRQRRRRRPRRAPGPSTRSRPTRRSLAARRARSATPRRRSPSASNEAGANFQCALDGAAFAACARPFTRPARRGLAHLRGPRRDAAGNPDATPATRTWTVDLTPPAAPAGRVRPGRVHNEALARVRFAASETVEVPARRAGRRRGRVRRLHVAQGLRRARPGRLRVLVRSADAAGNRIETRRAFSVTAPQEAQPTPTPSPTATPEPTPAATDRQRPRGGHGHRPDQGLGQVQPARRQQGHPVRLRDRRAQGGCRSPRSRPPRARRRPPTSSTACSRSPRSAASSS